MIFKAFGMLIVIVDVGEPLHYDIVLLLLQHVLFCLFGLVKGYKSLL